MSNQAKVTSYYTRKRKARDEPEPAAKRKRVDTEQGRTRLSDVTTLEAPRIVTARKNRSKASETLDRLFSEPELSKSEEPAPSPCELFAPKVAYHGRARRNVGSVLSLANNARTKTSLKEANRDWCRQPSEEPVKPSAPSDDVAPLSAASRFASLAAPMSLTARGSRQAENAVRSSAPKQSAAVPVQTKGQASISLSSTNDDLLPSTRLQRLAEPIKFSSEAAAPSAAKLSTMLPLPIHFKRLQEKMEATDNLLCLRRQYGGSFTQVKEGVQRMTRKEYTVNDVARMTTVLPPAYILTQEKVEKDYELHIKLNSAWKEDLKRGRGTSSALTLPSGTKEVIQLKTERKEAFRERLLSRVHEEHQSFLGELSIKHDDSKQLTHWHPKFKLDSASQVPCAELPEPPTSKLCSSASEVLQLASVKSEKVARALEAVAAASTAAKESPALTSPAAPKPNPVAIKSTLTPPPTPQSSETKAKEMSMKGIPSSLLEKIRKREAENAMMAMTCPVDREKEVQMWDKLPELCRVMCSVFIGERRDVLELGAVVKGLKQSIPSLQGSTNAQLEELLRLLVDNLKAWVTIVSMPSRPQRYVKLASNAKAQVNALLDALAKKRREFDNELRSQAASTLK
ncbi:DNA replication factor Cdt1-like [Sycon ciliatum]|uniref:DNA replication factor Cdt1-like n=1 Tax=Sycon ciliatum TaxID=27933 RepID=UPI0031F64F51|eukprot:scpid61585/ scgid31738/ DNA replication factor Cdt1